MRGKLLSCGDPATQRSRAVQNPQFEPAMSLWVDQLQVSSFRGLRGEDIIQVSNRIYSVIGISIEHTLQHRGGYGSLSLVNLSTAQSFTVKNLSCYTLMSTSNVDTFQ